MGKFIRLKKGFTINLAGKAATKITEVAPAETVAIKPSGVAAQPWHGAQRGWYSPD